MTQTFQAMRERNIELCFDSLEHADARDLLAALAADPDLTLDGREILQSANMHLYTADRHPKFQEQVNGGTVDGWMARANLDTVLAGIDPTTGKQYSES